MIAIHNKPAVLTPLNLAVTSEGESVIITVGDVPLRFHYEDALKISQWIRMRAKEAKRRAGDMSRHWSALATIDGVME